MSVPGKAEEGSQDDRLDALRKPKNDDGPASMFHKSSYVKDLKQLTNGAVVKRRKDNENEEVNEMDLTEEEKNIFNDPAHPLWEHSKIYSWVNASAEKNSIISAQKQITKSDLWTRERRRYNALMQYRESDFDWVEKDKKRTLTQLKNKETKEEKKWEFVIVPKKDGIKPREKFMSSYLSWILDPERTPFSEQSRVYSLPQYEEDFWNDMLSKGDPAKNLDPGYLTLDKVSFQVNSRSMLSTSVSTSVLSTSLMS